MAIDTDAMKKITPRLEQEKNVWLATVRPDGRPHLIPIWFVWFDGFIWIATARDSVKVGNVLANPRVAVALEDGDRPVIIEGRCEDVSDPARLDALAPAFISKFDWDIRQTLDEYGAILAIKPEKLLNWAT